MGECLLQFFTLFRLVNQVWFSFLNFTCSNELSHTTVKSQDFWHIRLLCNLSAALSRRKGYHPDNVRETFSSVIGISLAFISVGMKSPSLDAEPSSIILLIYIIVRLVIYRPISKSIVSLSENFDSSPRQSFTLSRRKVQGNEFSSAII